MNLRHSRASSKLSYNLIFILFLPIFSYSQLKKEFVSYGNIFDNGSTLIELQIKMLKNPCDPTNTAQNMFRLNIENLESKFVNANYFLNWKIKIIKCDGSLLIKTVSVSLNKYHDEGLNMSTDWTFDGEFVEKSIKATIDRLPNYDKDIVITNVKSVPPKFILGKSYLLNGESTTFTISADAKLGTKAQWVWYENNCGGKVIQRGPTIKISPLKNTTYYVRAESPNDTTECRYVKVEVDNYSRILNETKIVGAQMICSQNENVSLEVVGGKLGSKANWVWYKNSCGAAGELIGNGSKIFVQPLKTTTYFVRAEGVADTTACLRHTIAVAENITKPTIIAGESVICKGDFANLKVILPTLNSTANPVWYSDDALSKKIGVGDFVKVNPFKTTTYYVRLESVCNKSEAISRTVLVNEPSLPANGISYSNIKGRKYKLKLSGGSLGTGAIWKWSEGVNCEGNDIGTGSDIEYRAKKRNTIHVHAEGVCNSTNCVSVSFNHKDINDRLIFLNAGLISSGAAFTGADNLMATFGWKKFYVRVKFGFKKNEDGSSISETFEYSNNILYNFPVNNLRYYEINGEKYIKRSSFTGGYMVGSNNFRIYFGAGFGTVKPLYGVNIVEYNSQFKTKSWSLDVSNKYSGVEVEAGLFLKLGFLNIMGGISSTSGANSKRYNDGHAGIGITF